MCISCMVHSYISPCQIKGLTEPTSALSSLNLLFVALIQISQNMDITGCAKIPDASLVAGSIWEGQCIVTLRYPTVAVCT